MEISDAIVNIVRTSESVYRSPFWLLVCKVEDVDFQKRCISCTPLSYGPKFENVLLQSFGSCDVGFVAFPAVDSLVLVAKISDVQMFVVGFTELTKTILTIKDSEITVEDNAVSLVTKKVKAEVSADKLKIDVDGTTLEMDGNKSVWNGGSETTANATNLKQELTKMSARIDAIMNAIKSGVPSPMDGGAAYKASMIPIISAPPKEDFSNMIDDKIKH